MIFNSVVELHSLRMDTFYSSPILCLNYNSKENPMQWCADWSLTNCIKICKRLNVVKIREIDHHLCRVLMTQMGYKNWSEWFPQKLMRASISDYLIDDITQRIQEENGNVRRFLLSFKE
jgi:hypothetical protein